MLFLQNALMRNASNYTSKRTYAKATEGHPPTSYTTTTNTNDQPLLKFLDDFKAIINPYISLLNTVFSNLINTKIEK